MIPCTPRPMLALQARLLEKCYIYAYIQDSVNGYLLNRCIVSCKRNGFQKLDKIEDSNRQTKQLEDLTDRMRECKRLMKEFGREIKEERSINSPMVTKQLNDEKQSMGVWGEIDRTDPNPMKCPEDIKTYAKIRSDKKLFQFLNGLDRKFEPITREILRVDPLPTAKAAYATVRKEAAHQNILGATNNEPQGIATGLIVGETEGVGFTDGNKKGTKSAKTEKEKVPTTNTSSINKENTSDGRRSDGGFGGLATAENKGIGENIYETVGVQEHEEPTLTEVEEPTLTEVPEKYVLPKRYTPEKVSKSSKYPIANIAKGNLSKEAKAFFAGLYSEEAPSNVEQALKSKKLKNAMDVEMDALIRNGT
nr:ribonuclease H-like domain-containing protein [Tanacetum cinerariifolium]